MTGAPWWVWALAVIVPAWPGSLWLVYLWGYGRGVRRAFATVGSRVVASDPFGLAAVAKEISRVHQHAHQLQEIELAERRLRVIDPMR